MAHASETTEKPTATLVKLGFRAVRKRGTVKVYTGIEMERAGRRGNANRPRSSRGSVAAMESSSPSVLYVFCTTR